MTSEELLKWREDMQMTQRAAALAHGMVLKNYQQLERGINWSTGKPIAIDRRTALACSAIRAGLQPEGSEEQFPPGPNNTALRLP